MRSGFCAIVGRPNVGKSTLLNAVVGHKVAITTPVPQTTRHAIRGILHVPAGGIAGGLPQAEETQVVFVDTPGIHKPKTLLGSRLNDTARGNLSNVDCIVFVVDGSEGIGRGDAFLAALLADIDTPVIAVLNKVDRFAKARQLPQLQRLAGLGSWAEIIPLSAATGEGVDTLIQQILRRLPEGPPYFPPEQTSDQTAEQLVAELVREKAITMMREEVPHSIAVAIEEIVPGDSEDVQVVHAVLYVERDSQKGIVIGRGGAVLREIGAQARPEIEVVLGTRVFLDVRVKLMKEWQRDPRALDRLGY